VEDAERQELAELAAKFTVHGGGRVSPEVSADLALEIVLNEIAEQACLATPASGAAIVLKRDGEWVCRASAGDNSPRLGGRLDAGTGLSGACIKTRQGQRCDDAQSDPRADVEACRTLGVRAVIILPLLQNDEVVGVFEVFSSYPAAFGGRDERTLEVLSQRVLTLLKHTSEPPATSVEPEEVAHPTAENPVGENSIAENSIAPSAVAKGEAEYPSFGAGLAQGASEVGAGRGINFLTWTLGAVVLAFAVLLTVLIGQRLARGKAAARAHPPAALATSLRHAERDSTGSGGARETRATSETQSAPAKPSNLVPSGSATSSSTDAPHTSYSPPPAGSLLVYEKGREIFRMPPAAAGQQIKPAGTNQTGSPDRLENADRPASGVGRAGLYELSPEVAEGSILHRIEPDYPEAALQQHLQGPVVLDVRIGRDGTIQDAKLLSGQRLLADAAIAAVKQWQFRPRAVKGQPVEMRTTITLNFRLPR
jgi:TonB family protein